MNTTYKIYDITLKVLEEKPFYEGANSPAKITDFIYDAIKPNEFAEERFYIIALNTKGDVLGYIEHSRGSLNSSMVDIPSIFKFLLLSNAAAFIVTHNHPSGDLSPSSDDIASTKRLAEASKIMGISLLDHIITSPKNNHYSFCKNGLLDK